MVAKSEHQKLKLLYLYQYLVEETDEEHPASMQNILAYLNQLGIRAERKSIYSDLEALRDFGADIIMCREKSVGYYIGERTFELVELKLLVDAVQASKFITRKKSEELIRKIGTLTSRYQASGLSRQVYVTNRPKNANESIYYNVDKLHDAITRETAVRFTYFEWLPTKEYRLRRNGAFYTVSPWALSWDDENYYLIGYDHDMKEIRHYRVDKMLGIEETGQHRQGSNLFAQLDMAEYTKQTFQMFGGDEAVVTLKCSNWMAGIILDRFGSEVSILREKDYFLANVKVCISPMFFAWVFGFGKDMEITGPDSVVEKMREMTGQAASLYQSKEG